MLMSFYTIIPNIPLCKYPQAFSQAGIGLEAEVLFQWSCICISHWYITRLHWYKFLVSFKVIILGEHAGTHQLFLKDSYEVKEVFGGVVADVVHFVWRDGKSILAVLLLRGVLHDANHTFYNVINISKIALAVAIVEYLDGLAFNQFVGEAEVCHIGTTCRAINCKEAEAGRGDVVELRVGMGHQLVALLRGGVEAYGVVHLVICRIGHLLVATIDR